MKALSFWQPWGTLIALAGHPDQEVRKLGKLIETRSWSTDYSGPLAIHVSKRWDDDVVRWVVKSDDAAPIRLAIRTAGYNKLSELPLGCIIAVANLVDVKPTQAVRPAEPERFYGDFAPGRYAWMLGQVQVLPDQVPTRGHRQLWELDPATLAAVMEQLKEAT